MPEQITYGELAGSLELAVLRPVAKLVNETIRDVFDKHGVPFDRISLVYEEDNWQSVFIDGVFLMRWRQPAVITGNKPAPGSAGKVTYTFEMEAIV